MLHIVYSAQNVILSWDGDLFMAGLKRFYDEVVQHLSAPALYPFLQTSRSLDMENNMSFTVQDIFTKLIFRHG